MWYYRTGDNVWFIGNDSTEKNNQSLYTAPNNAKGAKFKVLPISETKKVDKTETTYWTADWSTEKSHTFDMKPIGVPPTPTVTMDKLKLTAYVNNLQSTNAKQIEFRIVSDDDVCVKIGTSKVDKSAASYTCKVAEGHNYKVRCRSINGDKKSAFSEYSTNVGTIPAAPDSIHAIRATSETSIYLVWGAVKNADTYDIQYADDLEYFKYSDGVETITGIELRRFEKTGLTSGKEYFFRVRAVNANGTSSWTAIRSVVIGEPPIEPTTWSSTTTAIVGEILTLYWMHNSKDGSNQSLAQVETVINGVTKVENLTFDETAEPSTSSFVLPTSAYTEGTKILWRVRTAGVTKVYGPWSIQRTVDVYAQPSLTLRITNNDGEDFTTLTQFPFYAMTIVGPNTQAPIGFYLAIVSNQKYETVDAIGNFKMVNKDEVMYDEYFDLSRPLNVDISANKVDLANNMSYTVTCSVTMNSGLTAEDSRTFNVAWQDEVYEPNLELGFNKEDLTTQIRPYCYGPDGTLVAGITLSVYRREFDGSFTEIGSDIQNTEYTYITDPHPALDFGRYRVIATSKATGAVSYYDPPGLPIGHPAIVIQWDEQWSTFETDTSDELEDPNWVGSKLELPYNIDISDKSKKDVTFASYVGRKRPVSYYGTQLGETSTWNVVIPKTDKETLYGLRRLSIWTGDVYVREPSGSGYTANVTVSFNRNHDSLIIPVTLDITRVEGGV